MGKNIKMFGENILQFQINDTVTNTEIMLNHISSINLVIWDNSCALFYSHNAKSVGAGIIHRKERGSANSYISLGIGEL